MRPPPAASDPTTPPDEFPAIEPGKDRVDVLQERARLHETLFAAGDLEALPDPLKKRVHHDKQGRYHEDGIRPYWTPPDDDEDGPDFIWLADSDRRLIARLIVARILVLAVDVHPCPHCGWPHGDATCTWCGGAKGGGR